MISKLLEEHGLLNRNIGTARTINDILIEYKRNHKYRERLLHTIMAHDKESDHEGDYLKGLKAALAMLDGCDDVEAPPSDAEIEHNAVMIGNKLLPTKKRNN